MIKAQIVADSINQFGNRLTTMVVTYPRIIHSEIMTHRMFSRNAASSRAVPANRLIQAVEDQPFIPIAFQKNHSGMQGSEYLIGDEEKLVKEKWLQAKDSALYHAKQMLEFKATKQLINRLIESYQYYVAIITATEWENFFDLRCPQYEVGMFSALRSWKDVVKAERESYHDVDNYAYSLDDDVLTKLKYNKGQAEIHMMATAEAMWDAYNESTPKKLEAGEWHIPYEDKIDDNNILDYINKINPQMGYEFINDCNSEDVDKTKVKISTVMCARVSYTTIDTDMSIWTVEKYLNTYDKLVNAEPLHASPMEHCAKTMDKFDLDNYIKVEDNYVQEGWCRNYRGFIQLRALIENGKVI